MKIFGWIQCKLRNSSSALLKDSRNGNNSCLLLNSSWNNQQDCSWPKNGTKISRKPQNDHFERYLSECNIEEASEGSFPGFLTIGTLNMESNVSTEPATPTFGFEEANEGHQMEETNYDLKHINDELEKFLKAEGENEGFNESRRTSVASSITLSGKEKDDSEAKIAFPLQGYLFATSYDLSVLEDEAEKERVSLLELFRRSREVDKNSCINLDIIEEDQGMKKYKAPTHPMRRILQTFQPSYKKTEILRNEGVTESSPTNKRFCKIKKLFQKKVHPEGPAAAKESNKLSKHKKDKTKPSNGKRCINEGFVGSGNGSCRSSLKNKSNGTNDEHWIRTDEDYLVLELGQK